MGGRPVVGAVLALATASTMPGKPIGRFEKASPCLWYGSWRWGRISVTMQPLPRSRRSFVAS